MTTRPSFQLTSARTVVAALLGVVPFAIPGAEAQPSYSVVHHFGNDIGAPRAGLTRGPDGSLYGTAASGGRYGQGSVFALRPNGSGGYDYVTLHDFEFYQPGQRPQCTLVLAGDGFLYGTTASDAGSPGFGTVFRVRTDGSLFQILHDFNVTDGANPFGGLVLDSGVLYGTAFGGGSAGAGTVFSLATDGSGFSVLHEFAGAAGGENPYAGLVLNDGFLYGTTVGGGLGFRGTVFRITTSGSTFTKLHDFPTSGSDGISPNAGLTLNGGVLYGTAQFGGTAGTGTLFKLNLDGTGFQVLHSFSTETMPVAALLRGADGLLYGTTSAGGTGSAGSVFRIANDGSGYLLLFSFSGTDGAEPWAGLIQDPDGTLFGATSRSGPAGFGTVFKMNTTGDGFQTLHAFGGTEGTGPAAALLADGSLYGTAASGGGPAFAGTVFKIDPDGTGFQTLHSFDGSVGATPLGHLVRGADDALYGTTNDGGGDVQQLGSIFKINDDGSGFLSLHSFSAPEGTDPVGGLVHDGGVLYGAALSGGASLRGTVFRMNTDGNAFDTLHHFVGTDGSNPVGDLIRGADGFLYGTTQTGVGASALNGVAFKVDANGSGFLPLHFFGGADGAAPLAGLVQAADGFLYGTTASGGSAGAGTVFRIRTNGADFQTLRSFNGLSEGQLPVAGLIQGSGGFLYGTTGLGGAFGNGVIFKTSTDGSVFEVLHDFEGPDGSFSQARLIESNGALFGVTRRGGKGDGGVVFRLGLGLPTATVSGDASICAESSASIAAALTGAAPWNLLWSDGVSQNAVASSPATRVVSPAVSTTYTVTTVTDGSGASNTGTGSAVITVKPRPTATVSGSATIAGGTSTTISATLTGTAPWTVVWSDGVTQSGVTTSPATRSVSPSVTTTYTVTSVSAANGCSNTGTGAAVITVVARPTATVSGTANLCAGSSTIISAALTGVAPWTLVWSDGVTQSGLSSSPATRSVSPSVSRTYTVTTVSDASGGSGPGTGSAVITVKSLPTAEAGPNRNLLFGLTATLGGSPTASGGLAPYGYGWLPTGGLDNPGAANPTVRGGATTLYAVTVTDANGCKATDQVTVTSAGNYVLLGDGSIKINQNKDSKGNVHSNDKIEFQTGAPGVHVGNLTAREDITIGSKNTIQGDAIAGDELHLSGSATVTGLRKEHANVAKVPLPNFSFSAGGSNVTVPSGGSRTLTPGSYGTVKVSSGGTLLLSAGDYFFSTLKMESSTILSINAAGAVNVYVVSELQFGSSAQVRLTGPTTSQNVVLVTLQTSKLTVSSKAILYGTLVLPRAQVQFSSESAIKGAVYASSISLDSKVKFYHHTAPGTFP